MMIAKRQRVENLRGIWPKETDFSDWLVTEDGLALIAEDIGIEIEDPQRECRPGDYPCDIVGRKVGDENHVVVIENQFGKTNHDHLGKMLTYAAMNSAMTGIWLSETVSDDHRKVIDWINDNTPPQVSFYLAEIKAYRIGDSPVAPQLDVVSRPNMETKVIRGETDSDKVRHSWRRQVWEEILSYIKEQNPPFNVQSPGIDSWSAITVGRSHFHIGLTLTPKRNCIGCELYMYPSWKESAYSQLQAQCAEIEKEIGQPLQWQPLPNKKAARILLETPIDPKNEANLEQVKYWMHEQAVKFYRTFQPRVKQLRIPVDANEMDDNE